MVERLPGYGVRGGWMPPEEDEPEEEEPDAGDPNGYTGDTTLDDPSAYLPRTDAVARMDPPGSMPAAALYTKVDYNWLAYFGTVLRDLDGDFQKAIDGLAPLTFNPGTRFARGRELQNEILGRSGGDGVKGAAVENLAHFRQAVAEMAGKVESLSKAYANSDELNGITADRVMKDMTEILGEVNLMPQLMLPGGAGDTGDGSSATS